MTTHPRPITLRPLAWALAACLCAAPAMAASPPGPAATAKAGSARGTTKPDAKAPVAAPKGEGGAIAALRREMLDAQRQGRESDLASLMFAGVVEGAFTALLHSSYALGSAGFAMQKGGLAPADVVHVAADMARNLGLLAQTWEGLAKEKALAGPVGDGLRELARSARAAVVAAKALEAWARAPEAATRAGAFEAAVVAYQRDLQEIARMLRGPERDRSGPETAPAGALPTP